MFRYQVDVNNDKWDSKSGPVYEYGPSLNTHSLYIDFIQYLLKHLFSLCFYEFYRDRQSMEFSRVVLNTTRISSLYDHDLAAHLSMSVNLLDIGRHSAPPSSDVGVSVILDILCKLEMSKRSLL